MKCSQNFYTALFFGLILLSVTNGSVRAQAWKAEVGLNQLRAENPGLTEGEGIRAHLVEAGATYAPNTTLARFDETTFEILGPSTAVSGHSTGSATQLLGTDGVARDLGTAGNPVVQVS